MKISGNGLFMHNKTKYAEIAGELSQDIFRSRFGRRLPNNIELAKIYETTPITIRKSLKLLQASGIVEIKQTRGGTVVTDHVFSRQKLRTVALVCSEVHDNIENIHFQKLFFSAQSRLAKSGFQLQIESVPPGDEARTKALVRINDMCRMGFYDGLLAMNIFSADEINHLLLEKIPLVVIGNAYDCNVPSVKHDGKAMTVEIISELERIEFKKAALLCKPPETRKEPDPNSSVGRPIRWLSERNRIDQDCICFIEFGGEFEKAEKATEELIGKHPHLDLFITYGSNISRGAYTVLKTQPSFIEGKTRLLPITDQDVIGDFPNLLLAVRELGEAAAKLLLESIEGCRHTTMKHVVQCYWHGREGVLPADGRPIPEKSAS